MIALGHHHVEIVADHENAAAVAAADLGDQFVEPGLADEIDGLHRLVEHQNVGPAQQGAGQQGALQFAARERGDAGIFQVRDAGFGQRRIDFFPGRPQGERQEPLEIERHIGSEGEALRHIADAQILLAFDAARGERHEAEHGAHQRRFAGAIGADHGDDLAAAHIEIDTVEDAASADRQRCVPGTEQSSGGLEHVRRSRRRRRRFRSSRSPCRWGGSLAPPPPWRGRQKPAGHRARPPRRSARR